MYEINIQGYIVQQRENSQYFITVNGIEPLKIMNHNCIPEIYNYTSTKITHTHTHTHTGFPSGSVVKNPPVNAGDSGSIPGSERSPGKENGYPLQYRLANPMDRGAWQATVHSVTKSQIQLND